MKLSNQALRFFIVLICIGCTTSASDLIGAVSDGDLQRVRELIDQGADVNKAEPEFGATPLFIASEIGHADVVKVLLASSADVNVIAHANGKDYTALKLAKLNGHNKIVKMLRKHGAKE